MLRHAVPPHRLAEHVSYDAPCDEAFDAVVLDGTNAIVFEIKGSFARAEAKYSGQFFRSLEAFRKSSAISPIVQSANLPPMCGTRSVCLGDARSPPFPCASCGAYGLSSCF